jgi:hypothetical protein
VDSGDVSDDGEEYGLAEEEEEEEQHEWTTQASTIVVTYVSFLISLYNLYFIHFRCSLLKYVDLLDEVVIVIF